MRTPASMTMMSFGSVGPAVALLQDYLNRIPSPSPKLVEDGDFGSKTRNRVREFQGSKALASDAVVGPMTWEALVTALGGPDQWLLGFAAESEAHVPNATAKLHMKHLDGILVNDIGGGRAFGHQANTLLPVTAAGLAEPLGPLPKDQLAKAVAKWWGDWLADR